MIGRCEGIWRAAAFSRNLAARVSPASRAGSDGAGFALRRAAPNPHPNRF
jgi:hypothetical protein